MDVVGSEMLLLAKHRFKAVGEAKMVGLCLKGLSQPSQLYDSVIKGLQRAEPHLSHTQA